MAVSSSKNVNALIPYTGKKGTDLVNEKIDERILRMLGLEDVFDIDYDTYSTLLKEKMAAARMAKSKIPTEETEVLTDEWRRIKGKKGRFKVTKKKITSTSIKKGSATGGIRVNVNNILPGSTVKSQLALPPSKGIAENLAGKNDLSRITSALSDIIQKLTEQNALSRRQAELDRKSKEQESRSGLESGLEKRFGFVSKAAEKVIAPVKGILQRIIDFLMKMLIGRAIMLLLDWFGDKKNQEKVGSIIKFFTNFWPALLGGFLIFGTGLGGFIANISGILIRGIAALATRNPIVLGTVIGGGLLAGVTKLAGNKKDDAAKVTPEQQKPEEPKTKPEPQQQQPTQKFAGGGLAQLLGGVKEGLTKNKALASAIGAAAGSALGPLGTILGAIAGNKSGKIAEEMSGLISGQKGVDKIPAMLSDGEFVMSRGAVQKYGVDTLESMNAAGGGTNKPKVMKGKVFAYGGGYVGEDVTASLRKKYDLKHGAGAYDKQLADKKARFAREDAAEEARKKRLANVDKKSLSKTIVNIEPNKPTPPKASPTRSKGTDLNFGDPKRAAENEIKKKARAEYAKIIKNMDHPDYDKAWNDPNYLKKLQDKYRSQATLGNKPKLNDWGNVSSGDRKPTDYTSRFAGARDAAHRKAQGITGESKPGWFQPGGMFGGPRMQARTDYAASKGKYYSSSDQKTYGSYNDAEAARKSRMASLASQQRLNKLSRQGANAKTGGKGIRDIAEMKSQMAEDQKRGGDWGKFTRGLTRMFSDPNSKLGKERLDKLNAADKASAARVKQAGAASIGRYYSSADGKYYKDYAAAKKAHQLRLAEQQKKSGKKVGPPPPPKITTKPARSARDKTSKGKGSASKGSSVPKFGATCPASKDRARRQKIYGIT